MGLPVEETRKIVMRGDDAGVPEDAVLEGGTNCKRLGLLTPWLRERFHELDILRLPNDAHASRFRDTRITGDERQAGCHGGTRDQPIEGIMKARQRARLRHVDALQG